MRYLALFVALVLPSLAFATEPAPLTGGAVSMLYLLTGTGTPVTALPADGARKFLMIQNVGANTNGLACTIDGSTPAIAANGLQLVGVASGAGQSFKFDEFVPTGAVTCIGSSSSTGIEITYLP